MQHQLPPLPDHEVLEDAILGVSPDLFATPKVQISLLLRVKEIIAFVILTSHRALSSAKCEPEQCLNMPVGVIQCSFVISPLRLQLWQICVVPTRNPGA